jgi:microcystin-dependent protein
MSQPYVGQIIAVGFDLAPAGWFPCNRQTLQISDYQVL